MRFGFDLFFLNPDPFYHRFYPDVHLSHSLEHRFLVDSVLQDLFPCSQEDHRLTWLTVVHLHLEDSVMANAANHQAISFIVMY